jgi:hypothetical protein
MLLVSIPSQINPADTLISYSFEVHLLATSNSYPGFANYLFHLDFQLEFFMHFSSLIYKELALPIKSSLIGSFNIW